VKYRYTLCGICGGHRTWAEIITEKQFMALLKRYATADDISILTCGKWGALIALVVLP